MATSAIFRTSWYLCALVALLLVAWLAVCNVVTRTTRLTCLPQLPPNARIMVVGNGPSVATRALGPYIDSADVVVRFNAAVLIPKHTGTKTDVHVVTAGSLRPHLPGTVPVLAYNHPSQYVLRPWPCVGCLPLDASITHHPRPTSGLVMLTHLAKTYPHCRIELVGFDGIKSQDFSREHYFDREHANRTWTDKLLTDVGMGYHSDETAEIERLVAGRGNVKRL